MKTLTVLLALAVVTLAGSHAVAQILPSPCCRASGSACDPLAPGATAGCIEDPSGSGTCIGGDLAPLLVKKLGTSPNAVLQTCVREDPPANKQIQRLEDCIVPRACVCIGDGTQVACFHGDTNIGQDRCTRAAVRGCCEAGSC